MKNTGNRIAIFLFCLIFITCSLFVTLCYNNMVIIEPYISEEVSEVTISTLNFIETTTQETINEKFTDTTCETSGTKYISTCIKTGSSIVNTKTSETQLYTTPVKETNTTEQIVCGNFNTPCATVVETSMVDTYTICVNENRTLIKTFSRGTYHCYGKSMNGGSGRQLISCAVGDDFAKGSIASSYLYKKYGYNYNGRRTYVYLDVKDFPEMTGYYYLDDSDAGNSNVIDFFYIYDSECPFKNIGVISVDCYVDY